MLRFLHWLWDLIFGEETDRGIPRERHTYMGAITGTYARTDPQGQSGPTCIKTGMWLLSGNGRTAGRQLSIGGRPVPELGKEVIQLNERMCNGAELRFPGSELGEFVIIGVPFSWQRHEPRSR